MFSEAVANFLTQRLGTIPYLSIAFGLFFAMPAIFLMACRNIIANGRRGRRDGLLLGFAVAAWASLCWLIVPYCGGYPCLPGLVAARALFGPGAGDTLRQELLVHAVNFSLWPAVGWLVIHNSRLAATPADELRS